MVVSLYKIYIFLYIWLYGYILSTADISSTKTRLLFFLHEKAILSDYQKLVKNVYQKLEFNLDILHIVGFVSSGDATWTMDWSI